VNPAHVTSVMILTSARVAQGVGNVWPATPPAESARTSPDSASVAAATADSLARVVARRDSLRRIRRDSIRRDSVRRDSLRRDSIAKVDTTRPPL